MAKEDTQVYAPWWKTFDKNFRKKAKAAQDAYNSGDKSAITNFNNENNGLKNLWNKWTGKGMTNAQKEAAQMNQQMNFDSMKYEQELNLETWRQTQSYEARVADMQNAGINPALMFANGSASAQSGAQGVSGSAGVASADPAGDITQALGPLQSVLNLVMSGVSLSKDNAVKDSQIALNEAKEVEALSSASNKDADTEIKGVEKSLKEIEKKYADVEKRMQLWETRERVQNIIADTVVKDGVTKVQQSEIVLNLSNANLADKKAITEGADAALKKLEARKLEKMLPYVESYERARIVLMNAQTSEALSSAAESYSRELQNTAEALIKFGLLEAGYVDKFLGNMDAETGASLAQRGLFNAQSFESASRAAMYDQAVNESVARQSLTEEQAKLSEKERKWYTADKVIGYISSYIGSITEDVKDIAGMAISSGLL